MYHGAVPSQQLAKDYCLSPAEDDLSSCNKRNHAGFRSNHAGDILDAEAGAVVRGDPLSIPRPGLEQHVSVGMLLIKFHEIGSKATRIWLLRGDGNW